MLTPTNVLRDTTRTLHGQPVTLRLCARKKEWTGLKTLDPRVLAGDASAIREFVAAVTPVIHARVARRLAPSERSLSGDLRQDVLDLTQDIFVHLFADGARVLHNWSAEQGLSLQNYVGLIAERRTISKLRSGRSNPWREQASGTDEYSGELQDTPEHLAAQQDEFHGLLERMKAGLSPQGWQLFDLLYIRELDVSDVGEKTGLSSDAVYAWRSRLRRRARAEFSQMQETTTQTELGRGT